MKLGNSRPFQNRPTKHTLKSERIVGNSVYSLEDHTLQEITWSEL
jgi:hypothetical protein